MNSAVGSAPVAGTDEQEKEMPNAATPDIFTLQLREIALVDGRENSSAVLGYN